MKRSFDPAVLEMMDRPQPVSPELERDLARIRQFNRWFGSYRLILRFMRRWIEPGARFHERRTFLGRTAELELEVTAYEQDRRFDVKCVSGPVRFEILHLFEAVAGDTVLRVTAEAPIGGALRLAAAMAKRQAERQFRSDLARLKGLLERQGSDP